MNLNNASISVSATGPEAYPKPLEAEVVLVGKSNVGKSSFVNSMLGRKKLARTSNKPGKTRQINFYNIDNTMYFVDLPGYGFSKMSKNLKAKSGKYIEEYLSLRDIDLVILLLDIRHDPTEDDIHMYNYILHQNIPFIVLCNKADKFSTEAKVEARVEDIKNILGISYSPIFPYSATNKKYVDNIWKQLDKNMDLKLDVLKK